ncbi:MAG: hypothetical protein ACYS7Y_29110 [Planctomycetota bacterium]|jgi:hypothetical protein
MAEQPVLMENTKIHSFTRFNKGVFTRNERFFRKVYADEITEAMCKSAGIDYEPYRGNRVALEAAKPAEDITIEVKKDAPEKAHEIEVDSPGQARPDIEDWDEAKLRAYCQENEIPTHPAARKAGLEAAITRYFNDLERVG